MATIRINDLTEDDTPQATDEVAIDGATTRKTTIADLVAIGRPLASQAEAEAGTEATKAMTPLTTAQAITAQGAVQFATAAEGAKANSAVQPGDLATVATSGAYGDLVGLPALGTAAATDADAYATAAQGAKADTAVQPDDLSLSFKNELTYADRTAAAAAYVPDVVKNITLQAYDADTDASLGRAQYREAADDTEYTSYPDALKFTDAGGRKFVISEPVIDSAMAGAKCDGTTDDTTALLALNAYMDAFPNSIVRISRGVSIFAGVWTPSTPGRVIGYGRDASVIKMTGADHAFYRASGSDRIDGFELSDFAIEGDWGGSEHTDTSKMSDGGKYPIQLWAIDNIRMTGMMISYSRTMGAAFRDCDGVHASGNLVLYCARDGISVAHCLNPQIVDNEIAHCDDDAIAYESEDVEASPLHHQAVIANNRVTDCQGIKVDGGQRCVITGNQIARCRAQGIALSYSDTEGNNAVIALNVSSNVITDVIDRSGIDDLNNNAPYIYISPKPPQAGDLAAAPGENDTATGTIVDLWGNLANNGTDAPQAGGRSIVVTGNVCMRTLPSADNYSDYGLGKMFTRNGWLDPAMTDDELMGGAHDAIKLTSCKDFLVSGNLTFGTTRGFLYSDGRARNGLVAGNAFLQFKSGGIAGPTAGGEHQIIIENNLLDGDPLHISAGRSGNKDGTWSNTTTGAAFYLAGGSGFVVRGNHVRNVPEIIFSSGKNLFEDNIIYAQPTATGYSASNKGVGGVLRSGESFKYIIEDSDPSSLTYGEILNTCPVEASAKPTAGTFVAGHFIRNNVPSIGNDSGLSKHYVVVGWLRVTTGDTHDDYTTDSATPDWVTMRSYID